MIPFRELWDEPCVAAPAETGQWRKYRLAADERDGHPVRIGAVADQPDDWLSAIANGYGIALSPASSASSARFYARPGITYRPVSGVSPSRLAVADHADDCGSAIRAPRSATRRSWKRRLERTALSRSGRR
ncbi:LysR substrate binding domain-containing protein [Streptomyces sp. Ncost-T10-10d]|nr:LysR substrate binding domain-containing protein [Streptomyces sp. Ncost-T10-10d]